MRSRYRILASLGMVLMLAGCGGKGVDRNIATDSEGAYRKALNDAWKEMTPEQQEAYNWAVSNYTLDQLIAKYPSLTPRKVIEEEATQYASAKAAEIASTAATFAANAERMSTDERRLKKAQEEIAKITIKPLGFVTSGSFGGTRFEYVVHNGSEYDISTARLKAWVFVDGEERSNRDCQIFAYFKGDGGLPRGKSLKQSFDSHFGFDCNAWNTLEVKTPKRWPINSK